MASTLADLESQEKSLEKFVKWIESQQKWPQNIGEEAIIKRCN